MHQAGEEVEAVAVQDGIGRIELEGTPEDGQGRQTAPFGLVEEAPGGLEGGRQSRVVTPAASEVPAEGDRVEEGEARRDQLDREGQAVEVSDEVVDRLVLEGGRGGASGLGPITEEREAVGEGQRLDADEDFPGNAEGTAAGHEDPQLAEERQPALEPCAEGDGAPVRLIEDQHSGAAGQAVGDRRGEGG